MWRSCLSVCLLAVVVSPAFAEFPMQSTCSEIHFAYAGTEATIQAVCLKGDGTPNATSLVLQGINNENGKLVQGSGPSFFQRSCGNIQIILAWPNVTLSALCQTPKGVPNQTSLLLNNIKNDNGNLTQ